MYELTGIGSLPHPPPLYTLLTMIDLFLDLLGLAVLIRLSARFTKFNKVHLPGDTQFSSPLSSWYLGLGSGRISS